MSGSSWCEDEESFGPLRGATDVVGRLHQLADLKAMGALTEKEFAAAKTRLLKE